MYAQVLALLISAGSIGSALALADAGAKTAENVKSIYVSIQTKQQQPIVKHYKAPKDDERCYENGRFSEDIGGDDFDCMNDASEVADEN